MSCLPCISSAEPFLLLLPLLPLLLPLSSSISLVEPFLLLLPLLPLLPFLPPSSWSPLTASSVSSVEPFLPLLLFLPSFSWSPLTASSVCSVESFLLLLSLLLTLTFLPLSSWSLLAASAFFLLFLPFLLGLSSDCGASDPGVPASPPANALRARERRARMSARSGNFLAPTVSRSTASRLRPSLM